MSGKRVDANHRQIVQALEQAGCSVLSLAPLGHGAPDLCVGFQGVTTLLEVKAAGGQQKVAQKAFQAAWRGRYSVVRSVDEALTVILGIGPAVG